MLVIAAGCGRFGFDETSSPRYAFEDEGQAAFDLGTYDTGSSPLVWRDGRVQFAAMPPFARSDVGIYVSRVFDTGDPAATWDTLAWVAPAPQGRALPDNEAGDEGYSEGAIGMANNLMLLHLDGAGSPTNGASVADASGRLSHGDIVLSGQGAKYADGLFGAALDLDRDAWVHLDGNYFDYGTGDFTYSVWVKMFDCSQSNDNRIALGGAGAGDSPHMWLGAPCPDACPDRDGAFMNWLDSTRTGPSVTACTGVVLDDGNWHHLAGVKQGHTSPAAKLSLYVDGREVGTKAFDFGGGTFTYDAGEIRLGGFNLGGTMYNTQIIVDEAAIWKRALTPGEIETVYRRGAVQLELQVRACPDGGCDGVPFVGPDGTTATYFTEQDLAGPPGGQRGNLAALGLTGSHAQYQLRFSTAMASVSPAVMRVTLEATP